MREYTNTKDILSQEVPSPCFVMDERLLRENLRLITGVREAAGVEIILAFKAFALWRTFGVFREYISQTTASSLAEARLALDKFGHKAHLYAPVYTDEEFDELAECSSHITFNSLEQFHKFYGRTKGRGISCGLRINPEVSVVETDLYNPATAGSRLGIIAELLPERLPEGVEGLHFHVLCESSSFDLEKVLVELSKKFDAQLRQVKWLNMGGGHLMTRQGYNTDHLVGVLKAFRQRYPHLQIILEPGAAFVWQTGVLKARVEDIVENRGVKTAMLNVSFACHMPDCLEMPYQPEIRGAKIVENREKPQSPTAYRMGGNSCLSGDFVGNWEFEQPLKVGDTIIFEDMIHYTTVKTTLFNGVTHPSIGWLRQDGSFELLRKFSVEDYFDRMC